VSEQPAGLRPGRAALATRRPHGCHSELHQDLVVRAELGPTGAGHLTVFPGDYVAAPTTSAINFSVGQTRANQAILPLAIGGAGNLLVDPVVVGGGSVHLIVDVVGYFE